MRTMIYQRDRKRKTANPLWRRLAGGVAVLLILFIFGAWWSGNAGWAATLAKPVWFIGERLAVGFTSLFAAYADKGKLVAENEALLNRLTDLEIALLRQDHLM